MPTVYSPRSQCEGKRPYFSKREAKVAARRAEHDIGRCRAYRCTWCDHWHIGHKPPTPAEVARWSTAPENVSGPGAVTSCPGPDQSDRS